MVIIKKGSEFMLCLNCEQQTEEGKFCTKCGAKLNQEEIAAAKDFIEEKELNQRQPIDQAQQQPVTQSPLTDPKTAEQPKPVQASVSANQHEQLNQPPALKTRNETVEKIKETGINFVNFFVPLLKRPSIAKNVRAEDTPSGIITLITFSLMIALGAYSTLRSLDMFFYELTFIDNFLLPFLTFLVLLVAMATITFFGVKFTSRRGDFATISTKYSAYTVPFMLAYVVGLLLHLMKFTTASQLLILISMSGITLAIPTFILFEKSENGFDRVYVLIGIYIANFILLGFLGESIFNPMLGYRF
ncbi:MAG TPA: hypothetical protein VF095_06120 [Bacillota bacterium]